MGYRILVDENTSPRVVVRLRENGHRAVHVGQVLEFGVTDEAIAAHATANDRIILTHDDDFLTSDGDEDAVVLYYSDDTLESSEIADRVDRVSRYVPDSSDLPRVTFLQSWE